MRMSWAGLVTHVDSPGVSLQGAQELHVSLGN